jgi:DNA-binding NtrC family response regulator
VRDLPSVSYEPRTRLHITIDVTMPAMVLDTKTVSTNENMKKRILTIDDDKDTSSSLKIALEQSGIFEVDPFGDPIAALASFKPDRYDAVILNVRMPDIDGFALYKKIKMIDKKIKICFLTTTYDLEYFYRMLYSEIADVLEEKGDCIIESPVRTEQLIKEINKLLRT